MIGPYLLMDHLPVSPLRNFIMIMNGEGFPCKAGCKGSQTTLYLLKTPDRDKSLKPKALSLIEEEKNKKPLFVTLATF
jgi:hypothetical protein